MEQAESVLDEVAERDNNFTEFILKPIQFQKNNEKQVLEELIDIRS